MTITGNKDPVILTDPTFLGTFLDGTEIDIQLEALDLDGDPLIWNLKDGTLPDGVFLTETGMLTGYIRPVINLPEGSTTGWDKARWEQYPWEFSTKSISLNYEFVVEVNDDKGYVSKSFSFLVLSHDSLRADNTLITTDSSILTADLDEKRPPILLTDDMGVFSTYRSDNYFAFKFDAIDLDGDAVAYTILSGGGIGFDESGANFDTTLFDRSTLALPPGLTLNQTTGWLTGYIPVQVETIKDYEFVIQAYKVNNPTYVTPPKLFTLTILGSLNLNVSWITPNDLGVLDAGEVSKIQVIAETINGQNLSYSLKIGSRLPQGLKLLPSGEISGKTTFESFSIDDHATTFDNELLTVDQISTFRVRAESVDGSSSSTRTFTLRLNIINTEPYEDLYLKAMPSVSQRQIYNALISDSAIFEPELIYRPSDPNFGIQEDLKMLFLPGLTASELEDYQTAMIRNHFTKTYPFGEVKTAFVLDNIFGIKYEVVYVEVNDPGENDAGDGPELSKDLSDLIANPYISQDGATYNIIYPNSSDNMKLRMETNIGYQDQSSLPPWMTSNQPDSNTATGFTIPLGYTKAIVIAYTKPGAGKKIAYRIQQSGIDFNRIEFTVDRYQLDNFYSENYDLADDRYIKDRETTFDADSNINIGTIVATVAYAVRVPYSQINGRPIEYILSNGGIDGIDNFADGQTLVFAQQEQFVDAGPYDGWIDYSASYIGDNTETSSTEGYDSGSYDTYSVIPGFLEKSQGTSAVNRRGGIWRIDIVNGIVNLNFVQEINTYDRVKVLFGKTLSSAILFYSLDLQPGQTVPYYEVFSNNPTIRIRTTFNNDTTKFFTLRDEYYEPGSQDKYVKFPQYGVFT